MKLVAFLFLIVQVSFGQISKNTIEKKYQLYHFNLEKCYYCVLLDKLTLNQPVFKSYIDSSNYQLIHVDRLHSKTQEKLKIEIQN
jgi:thioredoxin-related protein